jgi:hydroxymethylpyrimidine/phosphomethylpyrimidine kinase
LLQHSAIECLKLDLLPMASLITPNLPEAAQLLECDMAIDEATMLAQGKALLELGAKAVLMKGGHGPGSECIDLLITRTDPVVRYRAPRIDTRNTHGTGCTLSASIAAYLAQKKTLVESVKHAHAYLQNAIKAADSLQIGQGHGPVHHFHQQW